ncbi:hypothetical protein GCM10007977_018360 [Dactylosporangium sucinum]|uniref:Uncharacterized protein n=1 Tax=Dactylosporangium sucinum TaxID=1424081 RepID=A0A917TBJ9_9ACTN|nr:hypothetical protein GCM10007977_018360 [Dactylosporangium sucinum]
MLTNSPLRRWDRIAGPSHPDHLAAGEATTCAVYPDARNPFTFTDIGLEPWTVREIWYSGGPAPDHLVDVTDTFPRKLAALRAHVSQTSHLTDLDATIEARLAMVAAAGGLPAGRLAESFSVFSTA